MKNEFTRINLRVTREMYNWLKSEGSRLGVGMTSYIIMALETYKRQNEAMVTVEDFYKQLQSEKNKE